MAVPSPLQRFDVIPASTKSFFRTELRRWFSRNGRMFEWRSNDDPYRVLIAEILLQQTDAGKASLIYPDFIQLYPSIAALSRAEKDTVDTLIAKIGLSYRAERLIRIATEIEKEYGGRVPDTEAELRRLPGVGRYIAGAILCAAFGKRTPIVDTNVVRILGRFFGIQSQRSRPHSDPELWCIAEALLPKKAGECRAWNYALLDFCALVCKFHNPKCEECGCAARCWWLLKAQRQRR